MGIMFSELHFCLILNTERKETAQMLSVEGIGRASNRRSRFLSRKLNKILSPLSGGPPVLPEEWSRDRPAVRVPGKLSSSDKNMQKKILMGHCSCFVKEAKSFL